MHNAMTNLHLMVLYMVFYLIFHECKVKDKYLYCMFTISCCTVHLLDSQVLNSLLYTAIIFLCLTLTHSRKCPLIQAIRSNYPKQYLHYAQKL